jgi:hypothetical protein
MSKTQRKIISVSYLFVIEISLDLHKLYNFDFFDLHNVFFENYFANELTIDRSFLKQTYKVFNFIK